MSMQLLLLLFAAFCAASAGFNIGVIAARKWNRDEHRRWFDLAAQISIAMVVAGVIGLVSTI